MLKFGIDMIQYETWTPMCYVVRDHESFEPKHVIVSNYLCYKVSGFKWKPYNALPEVNEGAIYYMEEEPNFYA